MEVGMQRRGRTRLGRSSRQVRVVLALTALAVISFVGTAYALYDQYYGGYNVCGNNCYVQTSGSAHTYTFNATGIGNGGYMACQLFNYSGYNYVKHGFSQCVIENADPSVYKWARGYNQSGSTSVVSGYARTN